MKRSEFFKSLGGIIGLSIIAPKLIALEPEEAVDNTPTGLNVCPTGDNNNFIGIDKAGKDYSYVGCSESFSGGTSTINANWEEVKV